MNTGSFTAQVTRRRAPAVIVVSSLLLGLSGVARLAQLAAEVVRQRAYLQAHETVGTPSGFAAFPLVFNMGVALVVALFALALLVLAAVNLAGWNGTRIVTWIIGGVTLAVAGCGLALSFLPAPDGQSPDMTDWDRVNAVAGQLMPAWVEPVATLSGFVASPALLVAVVLLVLPAANNFYRSRREPLGLVYPGAAVQLQEGSHPLRNG